MKSLQLVKYDNFFKSYLTYIALICIWGIITAMTVLLAKNNDKVDYSMILPMANWMFLFFGYSLLLKQLHVTTLKERFNFI